MRLNITIPNTSPLLRFAPLQAWSEEEQVMDIPLLDDGYYRPKTYRVTNATVGGVLSFRWNGTGIWLYGGYRKRLGPYNVTLDGRVTSLDGFRAGDEEAGDGLLFGQGDLSTGTEHHLEVRPVWGTFDVDYVGFETEIMAVDVSSSVLDAASDNFAYASADADGDDGDDVHVDYHVLTSKYGSATPSGTVTSDSHIRLNYYVRIGVALYGTPTGSGYSYEASLDDVQDTFYVSATNRVDDDATLLYFHISDDFENRSHTLRIDLAHQGGSVGNMTIHHAIVYSGGTQADIQNGQPTHNAKSGGLGKSQRVAIGVGLSIGFLVLLLVGTFLFRRRWRRRRQEREVQKPQPFLDLYPWQREAEMQRRYLPPQPGPQRRGTLTQTVRSKGSMSSEYSKYDGAESGSGTVERPPRAHVRRGRKDESGASARRRERSRRQANRRRKAVVVPSLYVAMK